MRQTFTFAMVLVGCLVDTLPADENQLLSTPQEIDKKYPLPQDPATIKKVRETRYAENKAATLDVFKASLNAKKPWADATREAMEAYCRRMSRGLITPANSIEHMDFLTRVKSAAEAGSDDPLIVYWNVRFLERNDPTVGVWELGKTREKRDRFKSAVTRLTESKYPASIRVNAAWNYAMDVHRSDGESEEFLAAERVFWRTFGELLVAKDGFSQWTTHDISQHILTHYHGRTQNRATGWKKVEGAMIDAKVPDHLRFLVEGEYLIAKAWDARGTGYASSVTKEGWKVFRENLADAKYRLERAWVADKTNAATATAMLTVAYGQGFERDEMETWFRRAMELDPDNYLACNGKMEWLMPRWHGTAESAREFAYQCYRTRNWSAQIPLLLDPTAKERLSPTDPRLKPMLVDEDAWARVKAAHDGYVNAYPKDKWIRTRFALICETTDRLDEGRSAFTALEGKPWKWFFKDKQALERFEARYAPEKR